jgi:mannose-6-phosphate isomerase-like protein (cupin superfamily)
MTKGVKDPSGLYEVERRAYHAARPGFRIAELQISPKQKVPWHYHNNVHDTFYVLEGTIRVFLQQPKEEVRLSRGQTFSVPPKRPHLSPMQAKRPRYFSCFRASASTISCRSLEALGSQTMRVL